MHYMPYRQRGSGPKRRLSNSSDDGREGKKTRVDDYAPVLDYNGMEVDIDYNQLVAQQMQLEEIRALRISEGEASGSQQFSQIEEEVEEREPIEEWTPSPNDPKGKGKAKAH